MRYSRLVLTLTFGFVGAGPTAVVAQQGTAVSIGSRIRLTLGIDGQRLSGVYRGRVGDSVALILPGALGDSRVALDRITRLEVFRGRHHSVGKSALIGAAIGVPVGAVVGLAVGPCPDSATTLGGAVGQTIDCALFLRTDSRGGTAAAWAVAGAVSGALWGTVVGLIGHEQWDPATVPGWRPVVTAYGGNLRIAWTIPVGW